MTKRRYTLLATGIAIALALVAGIAVLATVGGASTTRDARAQDVSATVASVKAALGDDRIVTATVAGSTLSVVLNAPDSSSAALARFDGKVLARAVSIQLAADGKDAINAATYTDESGTDINQATDRVSSAAPASQLSSNACELAAAGNKSSLATVAHARTVSLVGGTCLFTLRASDVVGFDADAPNVTGSIASAVPDIANYPYLFEVVDKSGTTQMILGWIPGIGLGDGQGLAWIPRGASTPAVFGSSTGGITR